MAKAKAPRGRKRNPGKASPDGSDDQPSSLLTKYRQLAVKYEALVDHMRMETQPRVDLYEMATHALRTSVAGWVLLRDGQVAACNRAFHRLCQLGPEQMPWQLVTSGGGGAGDDRPRYQTLRQLIIDESKHGSRGQGSGDTACRWQRGEVVLEVSFEGSALGPGGSAVMVVIRDITERAQLEAELQRVRDTMARQERLPAAGIVALGIAHDVNNLLGALRMGLEVLQRDRSLSGFSRQALEGFAATLREGTDMMARLQSLGQPNSEAVTAVDLREVVAAALQICESALRVEAHQRGLELRIEHHLPSLPRVRGLRDELVRVFVNLLINARDAMPRGGVIRIAGRQVGSGVVVTVEDPGTGIAPADAPHLFSPFFTTKGAGGNGLGLAQARAVMEQIGGSIAASNRPGGGASIQLTFVKYTPRARRARAPGRAAAARRRRA